MACDYEAFHNYTFDKDERFQRGFRKLENMQPEEKIRAKAFYYNKFVKPVDLEGYKRWLSFVGGDSEDLEVKSDLICEGLQHQGTVNTACVNVKQKMELEGRGSTGVHISAEQSDDGQGGDVVEVRSDSVHCGEENLTETINTECCLSFSEILHIVDTGQEIPGLKKLNILPTNQNPTVSHLLPKPKPWDITN